MASDPLTATWQALVACLTGDTGVSALVGDRVVEDPEDGIEFPYVTLGRITRAPDDTDTTLGHELTVGLEVHSRPDVGRSEASGICAAINEALHRKPELLSAAGFTVFDCEVAAWAVVPTPDRKSFTGTIAVMISLEV